MLEDGPAGTTWKRMTKGERVYLFDTTLRDGAQTQGVDFSVADKAAIARELDALGIDYVEGGWPGANPTDNAFFAEPPALKRARFTAFGMTRRPGRSAANDPGLAGAARRQAPTPSASSARPGTSMSTWRSSIPRDENVAMIARQHRPTRGRKVDEALFDAEHFFDGYKANPDYALRCITAAYEAGARWIVLCDTNGGTLPHEVEASSARSPKHMPGDRLGIHCPQRHRATPSPTAWRRSAPARARSRAR